MFKSRYLISLLTFVAGTSAADGILRCDGCSTHAERTQVKLAGEGYFYVFDMVERQVNKYYNEFDREAKRYFVTSVNTPASLHPHVNNFIEHFNRYDALVKDNPTLLRTILDEVIGLQPQNRYFDESVQLASQAPNCSSDRANDAKIHDFLVNSSLRRNVYKKTVQYYPEIQNVFNAWNNLVSHVDFSAGGVGVNTNIFAISQRIMFADGATVGVVANPDYLTFDIVPGSAVDCNGNNIPLPSESLVGDYSFTTADGARRFSDYAQYFGAAVGNYPVCSATSQAKCTWNGITKRYSCNFTCL